MPDVSYKDVKRLTSLQESFQGDRLIKALRTQAVVQQDTPLATRLAQIGTVAGFPANSVIYKDGDIVKGLWFLLHGLVEIRDEGDHLALNMKELRD